jgi:peptidoglycan/xylan/chitin deacetylase (PgdA/CDA1 family)
MWGRLFILAALAAAVWAAPARAQFEPLIDHVRKKALQSVLSKENVVTRPSVACTGGAEALGIARVLPVGTQGGGAVGRKSYPQTLPLADKEVVLTFDDGPWPGTTRAVLDALAAECTHGTFFLVGQRVRENPAIARTVRDAGHTIAYHSMTHPNLSHLSQAKAEDNILHGIAAVDEGVGPRVAAPFFRFPGFADTPELVAWLGGQNIGTFGTDIWASDWNPMTPEAQLRLILSRLEQRGRGILLFHDTKKQTAAMLPAFLRELKKRGYRVVALVPAPGPMQTAP